MEPKEALAVVTQVCDQFVGKWADQLVVRDALRVLKEAIEPKPESPALSLVGPEDEGTS